MLKALFNEAQLCLDITTIGPLLVKSGYATIIGANMAPVQTYRNGDEEVYIPGSSLKGIFRSHAEKIINSIKPLTACNPFQTTNDADDHLYRKFCGQQFTNKSPAHKVYAGSCPACRLFGSTEYAGRLAVQDAYLQKDETTAQRRLIEHRDGVGIDRLTGGAKPMAKFDLDAVTADTTFSAILHLRNFEIWQLGLLFVIIQDMEDELIRIGSGRSRGLGKVTACISEREEKPHQGGVVLSTTRTGKESKEPAGEVWGLGSWLSGEGERYGTERNDIVTLSAPLPPTSHGIRNLRVFKGNALTSLREQCVNDFVTRMSEWTYERGRTTEGITR